MDTRGGCRDVLILQCRFLSIDELSDGKQARCLGSRPDDGVECGCFTSDCTDDDVIFTMDCCKTFDQNDDHCNILI